MLTVYHRFILTCLLLSLNKKEVVTRGKGRKVIKYLFMCSCGGHKISTVTGEVKSQIVITVNLKLWLLFLIKLFDFLKV